MVLRQCNYYYFFSFCFLFLLICYAAVYKSLKYFCVESMINYYMIVQDSLFALNSFAVHVLNFSFVGGGLILVYRVFIRLFSRWWRKIPEMSGMRWMG